MQTVKFNEPFKLVMERPLQRGEPLARYEVTCVIKQLPLENGGLQSKIFIKSVKDIFTGDDITDDGLLPSISETIAAMKLRDWAAINEEHLMGDSKSFTDNFA